MNDDKPSAAAASPDSGVSRFYVDYKPATGAYPILYAEAKDGQKLAVAELKTVFDPVKLEELCGLTLPARGGEC